MVQAICYIVGRGAQPHIEKGGGVRVWFVNAILHAEESKLILLWIFTMELGTQA